MLRCLMWIASRQWKLQCTGMKVVHIDVFLTGVKFLWEICLWMDQILDVGKADTNVRNSVSPHFTSFSTNHWCCRSPYCHSIMLYFLTFQGHMPLVVATLHTEQRCWSSGMAGFCLFSLWTCCVHTYSCALSLSDCILHDSIQAPKSAGVAQLSFQQSRLNIIFLFSSVVSFFSSSNRRLLFSVFYCCIPDSFFPLD